MARKINIDTSNKPLLDALLKSDIDTAKEIISVFTSLMEETLEKNWHNVPKEIFKTLTFGELIRGILRGSLDLKDINPEAFDVLGIEVHPLSILSPRMNYLDNRPVRRLWRQHFGLSENVQVNEDTIAQIYQNILRYTKFVKVEDLAKAMENNQLATYRGLGERNVALLPMMPALRYQREHYGELHVGKLNVDNGFLDCGEAVSLDHCHACKRPELTVIGSYHCCPDCNASFKEKSL